MCDCLIADNGVGDTHVCCENVCADCGAPVRVVVGVTLNADKPSSGEWSAPCGFGHRRPGLVLYRATWLGDANASRDVCNAGSRASRAARHSVADAPLFDACVRASVCLTQPPMGGLAYFLRARAAYTHVHARGAPPR